jgi:hypothetical protein
MGLVKMQVRSIMNLGLWDKVCDYKDWNPYILREGRIDYEDWVEFDDEFKKQEDDTYIYFVYDGLDEIARIESSDKLKETDVISIGKVFYDVIYVDSEETSVQVSKLNVIPVKIYAE